MEKEDDRRDDGYMDSQVNAGCVLVLTQTMFPPFAVKPGGSAPSLITAPGWNT